MTHNDKVAIRKAIVALRRIDESEQAGYDDPITVYYGGDAADAVAEGSRRARARVIRKLTLVSPVAARLLARVETLDALDVLEGFAYRARLLKGKFSFEVAKESEQFCNAYRNG